MNRDPSVSDVLDQARGRQRQMRQFLDWVAEHEASGNSLRAQARPDIADAKEAIKKFPDNPWWGLVIFSCFGSLKGAETAARCFRHPVRADDAVRILDQIGFEKGSVGHHRIQATLKGGKEALVSACANAEEFRDILLAPDLSFDDRFQRLRGLGARQWGRTTCFDLVLRAGVLGISGEHYLPDRAYLRESRGPETGFQAVWGITLTKANEERCEGLLREWSRQWSEVAKEVGVTWPGEPYTIADLENALCIYQEHLKRPLSNQSLCFTREPSRQRKC